jgi:hypothetical protein
MTKLDVHNFARYSKFVLTVELHKLIHNLLEVMMKTILLVLLVLSISSCSKQEESPKKVATPWDDQIETLRETEKLEQSILDAAEQRNQEMEQQLQ